MATVKDLDAFFADFTSTLNEPGTTDGSAIDGKSEKNEVAGVGDPKGGVIKDEVDAKDEGHASEGVSDNSPKGEKTPSYNPDTTKSDKEDNNEDDKTELSSWDELIEEPTTNDAPKEIDWSKVSEVIGLDKKASSPEDVKRYIETLRKENDDLKNRVLDDSIPVQLREAIEVAKQGGDFYTYLGITQVDYSKIAPEDLFEQEVANLFYDDKGNFDEEGYNEYLDAMPAPEKKLRGLQMQRELIRLQQEAKEAQLKKIADMREKSQKRLEATLQNLQKVGDFDVTPKVKKQLYDNISSGTFLSELGISQDGNHDWGKLLPAYFKFKYFDAIQNYVAQRARAEKTRKDLEKLTNPNVKGRTVNANPSESKPKTGFELYMEHIFKQLKPNEQN